MLQLANTRFGSTFHREVLTGVTIHTEGVALVYVMEQGKTKVRPSTGAKGEVFAGFSLSRNSQSARLTEELEIKVPATAPYSVTLPHAPVAGQFRAAGFTVAADADAAAPAAAEVGVVGKQLNFNAAAAGKIVRVSLAYEPTYLESVAAAGNDPVGGLPSSALGVIGVIKEGDVFTDQYDVTAEWKADGTPQEVYLSAGGLVTTKTDGTHIGSVNVLQVPSVGSGFLGLTVRSAG